MILISFRFVLWMINSIKLLLIHWLRRLFLELFECFPQILSRLLVINRVKFSFDQRFYTVSIGLRLVEISVPGWYGIELLVLLDAVLNSYLFLLHSLVLFMSVPEKMILSLIHYEGRVVLGNLIVSCMSAQMTRTDKVFSALLRDWSKLARWFEIPATSVPCLRSTLL